jgi:hypothetical protein
MGLTPSLFTSAKPDGSDPTKLQPSFWNRLVAIINSLFNGADAHGSLLYRDTADVTDGASWLPDVAAGSVLVSGGVGAAPAWSASPIVTKVQTDNGTASLPAWTFSTETGLGLYRSSAGQLTVGNTNVSGGIPFTFGTNGMQLGSGMLLSWSSSTSAIGSADTTLARSAAGKLTLTGTTPMLQLGGTTAGFPAVKRDTVFLQLRLADDSGVSGAATASLPAAAAARDGIIGFDTTLNALVYYVGGARFKLVGTAF